MLLEKPMAQRPADCDRMIAAAERAGVTLMVGHICRFNPRYAIAPSGSPPARSGGSSRCTPVATSPRHGATVLEKIGPLLGDGVHDTDLMLWMSGAEIKTAYALTESVRGLKHPDIGWAMYRFDTGTIGVIEDVWFLPEGTPFRIHEQLEIIGTEGSIYVHGGDMNVVIQGRSGIDCPDTLYWPEMHGSPIGELRSELEYFVNCVAQASGRKSSRRPKRKAVAAVAAAERSAETGKVVPV